MTINWAQCHTRPVLMIPGPTELPFPVIQAMNQPVGDPVRPELRRRGPRADDPGAAPGVPDPERGLPPSRLRPHRARGGRPVGDRAGRPCARHRRGPVRRPHARDHESSRRRLDRVPGRAGRAPRSGPSGPRGRAAPSQGDHPGPQRNLDRHDLPGGRGGPDRAVRRCALPARHGVLDRRHRRPDRRVGRRPQHDRLAEMSGGAARDGGRLGEPTGVRDHGAPQARRVEPGLRPASLEGPVGARLARGQGPRRIAAAPAGFDPDASHQRDARRDALDPGGRARRTASSGTPSPAPRSGAASTRWASRCSRTRPSSPTRCRA